jgi:hypothetical protein
MSDAILRIIKAEREKVNTLIEEYMIAKSEARKLEIRTKIADCWDRIRLLNMELSIDKK